MCFYLVGKMQQDTKQLVFPGRISIYLNLKDKKKYTFVLSAVFKQLCICTLYTVIYIYNNLIIFVKQYTIPCNCTHK